MPGTISTSEVISVLFNSGIYDAAPYFSMHPDHPLNPMKDHSKLFPILIQKFPAEEYNKFLNEN
jgi:hypothetical protein